MTARSKDYILSTPPPPTTFLEAALNPDPPLKTICNEFSLIPRLRALPTGFIHNKSKAHDATQIFFIPVVLRQVAAINTHFRFMVDKACGGGVSNAWKHGIKLNLLQNATFGQNLSTKSKQFSKKSHLYLVPLFMQQWVDRNILLLHDFYL